MSSFYTCLIFLINKKYPKVTPFRQSKMCDTGHWTVNDLNNLRIMTSPKFET